MVNNFQVLGYSKDEINEELKRMLFHCNLNMNLYKNVKEGTENYKKYLGYAKVRENIKKEIIKLNLEERRRK